MCLKFSFDVLVPSLKKHSSNSVLRVSYIQDFFLGGEMSMHATGTCARQCTP